MTVTASPETDLAVAKACGFEGAHVDHRHWKGPCCIIENRGGQVGGICGISEFRPSTDLNDAFLAVEKAAFPFALVRQHWAEQYCIESIVAHVGDIGRETGSGFKTAALAICAAILKFAERP